MTGKQARRENVVVKYYATYIKYKEKEMSRIGKNPVSNS